jgi:two-component system, NtrC family, response regulator HydG
LGKQRESAQSSYFEVDLEEGVIKRADGGQRVLALGSVGWATLQQELSSTFVTGAAVILQRMGYSYGRYLGNVAKKRGLEAGETLEALLRFSREAGWGKLSLNSGDMTQGQAHLVVRGCYFCLHLKDSQAPVCHMLTGLIGGVADEMTGKTHRVLEGRCIGKGDATCEIIVERLD